MLLRYCFVWLFALQVAIAPWLSSASRIAIQANIDEDLLLVCTGAEYRWISLSASAETGQFSFVEPPLESPTLPDNDHVPLCLLGWLQLDQSLTNAPTVFSLAIFRDHWAFQSYVAGLLRVVVHYSSRAPPSSLIA